MQRSSLEVSQSHSATVAEAMEFFRRFMVTPRAARRHLESLKGPPYRCILDNEAIELDHATRSEILELLENHAGPGALS